MIPRPIRRSSFLLVVPALLCAVGSTVPAFAVTLTNVAVTPATPTLGVGQALQMTATGTFSDSTQGVLTNPTGTVVAIGDLDGDGKPDLVVANGLANTVSILLNSPPSVFLSVSKVGTGSGTVTSIPPGIDCGSTCSASFESATIVTLTATPATGSSFAGWSGDPDCYDGVVTMDAAGSCIATFYQTSTLTITKIGTGTGTVFGSPGLLTVIVIDCGSTCQTTQTSGTVVNLTAVPDSGSFFAGWTGDPDCLDGVVTLNADKACTATFTTGTLPVSPLTNISTRARVQTGDNVMIGGFIVGGSVPKTVLIRARGGSLGGAPFFNPGALANPTIQLFSGQTVIAQNDDWQTTDTLCLSPAAGCGGEPEITATGLDPCQPNPGQTVPPPGCAQESALYVTLPPGVYTAIVRGVGGTIGMGLVEVFEADTGPAALTNISTRARVETADNVMIGGFIVGGSAPKTVLIRARGGSLGGAPFFNPGVLADPTIQLYSGQTVIAQNNDWQTRDPLCLYPAIACGGGVVEIMATGLDPCRPNPGQTVEPPGCAKESALYVTLLPGTYTVIVRGVGGTSGMGLVEVFAVSP